MVKRPKCHPDRPHKAYGWCEPCYRRMRYQPSKFRNYHPELIEYLETHPTATWNDLADLLHGNTRHLLAASLARQSRQDLVRRVDKHSGTNNPPEQYGARMVALCDMVPTMTWTELVYLFHRSRPQLDNVLRYQGRLDIIRRLSDNTKGVYTL